jgi:uncharacterized membrane protein
MLRKYFAAQKESGKEKIRWRSHEVTRIEAFSDAVFAFAVSLLVISLEVPKNSKELLESLWGLVPFTFCFLSVFWVWRAQYKFFRRYGLHDGVTIALNGLLMFVVLCFVYPLKFLISSAIMHDAYSVRREDLVPLAVLYNGGFAVIGFLICAMYLNALWRKDEINLTQIEIFETRSYIWTFAFPALASTLAVVISMLVRSHPENINICFFSYALLGIVFPFYHRKYDRAFKKRFGTVPMVEPHHGTEG